MSVKRSPPPTPKLQSLANMDVETTKDDTSAMCDASLASANIVPTASSTLHAHSTLPLPLLSGAARFGASVQQYGSTPNLSDGESVRAGKRKHDGTDDTQDFRALMNTMRGMFTSFTLSVESRLNALQESLTVIRDQNSEITKSIDYMSEKYDEMLKRVEDLEQEKRQDKKTILALEEKLEFFERKSRSSCLEIRNIPGKPVDDKKPESKSDLCNVLKTLSSTLSIKLEDSEVKDIYRTSARKDSMRPIVVEFCSIIKKDSLLRAVKDFNKNKSNENKLNTVHLNLAGPKKGIFISETLTLKTQQLFYKAREFAKEFKYNYCWSSRGLIYLRKAENLPYVRIMSESDIQKLKGGI